MNNKLLPLALTLILSGCLFFGCSEDEKDKTDRISGLWIQEKVTEDGREINFPGGAESLSLLIESNGVYRTYAKEAPVKEHFGAWTITDDTWLELTVDTWRVNSDPLTQKPENQWVKNHKLTRFTILTVSDNTLEIRLKTFVGEQKYAALFMEQARPLITSENQAAIAQEYKTLKTYVYTFKKGNI